MTLTPNLPIKALASVLATLTLAATLAVAVPLRAELPGALSALEVSAADAHRQERCFYERVELPARRYRPAGTTVWRRVCVNVEHSHWLRDSALGFAGGTLCGLVGGAAALGSAGIGGTLVGPGCSVLMGGVIAWAD